MVYCSTDSKVERGDAYRQHGDIIGELKQKCL